MFTLIILKLLCFVQTGDQTFEYVNEASGAIIHTADEGGNDDIKIIFPSFAYRIQLLLYFIIPVFLFVLLIIFKIYQQNREEADENITISL